LTRIKAGIGLAAPTLWLVSWSNLGKFPPMVIDNLSVAAPSDRFEQMPSL
jgi:hypothetical protein